MFRSASMLFATCLLVSIAIADQSYLYEISLRSDNEDVQTVEVKVIPGQSQQIFLEGNLRIEFSPNVSAGGDDATHVQLMRSANLQVLHTATQSNSGVEFRRIAYVVCGEQVTFMSPAPTKLPTCETDS